MRVARALLALALPAAALAAHAPQVRVRIEQSGPIYVGQSLRIDVTVLVPNFFMSSPQFPLFDLPGAVVTMPGEGAVNVSETISGVTYAGIQRSYVIIPQRDGRFVLPPARITFQYAAVPGQPSPGSVTLPPQKFDVLLPPGAKTPQGALPVARVTIDQQVAGLTKPLHVGDAITRRVEIFADHTQSMMIPPPSFAAPAGVRVYRKDPQLADVTDERGQFLGGRRVDVATYLFDRPGTYTLPEISVSWFDPRANRAQLARAPDIQVSVAPNPQAKAAIAPEPPVAPAPEKSIDWRRWLPPASATILAAFAIFWLTRRWAKRVRTFLATARAARRESEAAYFSRVLAACHANDPARSYAALGRWAWRADRASIGDYLRAADDDELCQRVTELEHRLYSCAPLSARWAGTPLATALKRTRRSFARRQVRHSARHRLSMLNPPRAEPVTERQSGPKEAPRDRDEGRM
jgi:hypothetical protein